MFTDVEGKDSMLTKLTPKEQLNLALELLDDMSTTQEKAGGTGKSAILLPMTFATYALSAIALQGINVENGVIKGSQDHAFSKVRTNLVQIQELLNASRIDTIIKSGHVEVYIRKAAGLKREILAKIVASSTSLSVEVNCFDYWAHLDSDDNEVVFYPMLYTEPNFRGGDQLVLKVTAVFQDDEDITVFIRPSGRALINAPFGRGRYNPKQISFNWKDKNPQVIPEITMRDEYHSYQRSEDRQKKIQRMFSLLLSPQMSHTLHTLFNEWENPEQ